MSDPRDLANQISYQASHDALTGPWPLEPEVAADLTVPSEPDAARGTASTHTRQTEAGAPFDLMAVYDNLVPMIHAQCGDLASTPNPVMFAFIDTCAPQGTTSMRGVPADVARALWAQGLQALRDIGDAALDPSHRIDVMSRLGLERSFCPDLALLVFQFWSAHEIRDGQPHKRRSDEPRVGAPHRLQVELRAYGCAPVIVEWKVLQRDGNVCAVPPPPRHFVGPWDLTPPRLPTAAEVAAIARLRDEDIDPRESRRQHRDERDRYGWAILVTLPTGYKSHDYNVIAAVDGVTPVIFETEDEARAVATGPKFGPLLARIDYPWRIAIVTDPFPYCWFLEPEAAADPPVLAGSDAAQSAEVAQARQTGVDAPLDLMAAYDSLRNMVAVLSSDLESAGTSIPVILGLFHTCAPHLPTIVPTDIACALWAEGLPTLRDALDAALDPVRQVNAVSRLGLPPGFRPNVAVMVYQFWPVPHVFDGRLLRKEKRQTYKPNGLPRRLHQELRAHGCVPVVAESMVLPGIGIHKMVPAHYAQP